MVTYECDRNKQKERAAAINGQQTGLYNDSLIENFSSRRFYAVYPNGSKRLLEPLFTTANASKSCIRYTFTVGFGGLLNEGSVGNAISNVNRYLEEVPIFRIIADPHFIKDIGVVLCTEEQLPLVAHPYMQPCFEDALEILAEKLSGQLDQLSIHFSANDPTGVLKHLYVQVLGNVTTISVTNVASKECTLIISMVKSGKSIYRVDIPMATIREQGGYIDTKKGFVFYVALTEWEMERIVKTNRNRDLSVEAVTSVEAVHELEELKLKYEHEEKEREEQEKLDKIKHDQDLRKRDLTIDELKTENNRVKLNNTELESRLAAYRGTATFHEEVMKHNVAMTSNDEKIKQSQMKLTESRIKLTETIIKVGVPIILMVGTWVIARYTRK